jgi:hypothetical protein
MLVRGRPTRRVRYAWRRDHRGAASAALCIGSDRAHMEGRYAETWRDGRHSAGGDARLSMVWYEPFPHARSDKSETLIASCAPHGRETPCPAATASGRWRGVAHGRAMARAARVCGMAMARYSDRDNYACSSGDVRLEVSGIHGFVIIEARQTPHTHTHTRARAAVRESRPVRMRDGDGGTRNQADGGDSCRATVRCVSSSSSYDGSYLNVVSSRRVPTDAVASHATHVSVAHPHRYTHTHTGPCVCRSCAETDVGVSQTPKLTNKQNPPRVHVPTRCRQNANVSVTAIVQRYRSDA